MSTLLIKTDTKNGKILAQLAKQLGGDVIALSDTQFEDLMLGTLMDSVKTGTTVSKSSVLTKLCPQPPPLYQRERGRWRQSAGVREKTEFCCNNLIVVLSVQAQTKSAGSGENRFILLLSITNSKPLNHYHNTPTAFRFLFWHVLWKCRSYWAKMQKRVACTVP